MKANDGSRLIVCNADEEGRFGGPERRIVLVAEGLRKYGIDVLILIPVVDSEMFESEIQGRGLWYSKLSYSRLTLERRWLIRYVLRFPFELMATAAFLRRNKVELVHVNGSYQFRSALAACIARKKVVWHVNDAKMHWLVKAIFGFMSTRIASGFVFSSAIAREYYFPFRKQEHGIPAIVIAPPVQVERFGCRYELQDVGRNPGRPVRIVTTTGINPDKGLETLIKAASIIHSRHPNVRFIVAAAIHESHARYFEVLRKLIESLRLPDELIQFVGFVNDIPAFLLEGDIFLYTSNTEAGPAAVWEAMAAGLPVVTTSVGAIPEYLVHGKDALITQARDAAGLAELTLELIDNPHLQIALGQAARKKVEENLSVDAAARKHAGFYRSILRQG